MHAKLVLTVKMFECSICHQAASTTTGGILRHIRLVHPYFNQAVTCGVNGCPSTASTYESLRKHMYRYRHDIC